MADEEEGDLADVVGLAYPAHRDAGEEDLHRPAWVGPPSPLTTSCTSGRDPFRFESVPTHSAGFGR